MASMRRYGSISFSLAILALSACTSPGPRSSLRFEISFPASLQREPLDGRAFLIISDKPEPEPRFLAADWRGAQPLFGVDVEGWRPDQAAVVDDRVLGYPVESIAEIPAGDYYVQGLLNVYTTFPRADGHRLKMHMDQWEGQQWNISPGNLLSEVQRVHLDPASGGTVRISLTKPIPPIEPPKDTRYIKHVKIKSEKVSKFWGHDMYVGAALLLPEGFETHPKAHYPVTYLQNHFRPTFGGFREAPPARAARGTDSASQGRAYAFYKEWTSGHLPKFLVVMPQDPNPYYDDSYAVNTANVGPYGDALTQELIPYVENQFRGIGAGWARTLYGGSTGGWRALALQVFYPDFFNGTWAFCPDPVDFRYFQLINIYQDSNAYHPNDDWKKNPNRPVMRGLDNQVLMTEKEFSTMELVLGTRGRSGEQMDIFQAVFGPVGPDGYTKLLWDKRTGVVDHSVVPYWRDHYDLRHILERDWPTLGPKLKGKIHVAMGDADTFYLEEAAYLLEQFLEGTKNPTYGGSFTWGKHEPHCYTGTPPGQNVLSYYLPQMATHLARTAPPGADLRSWKY